MEISLNELIRRQNLRQAEMLSAQGAGDPSAVLAANIKNVEDHIDHLNGRLERRRQELEQEKQCTISAVEHLGRAWVVFFFQAEDGIRDYKVTGVQTCALPISRPPTAKHDAAVRADARRCREHRHHFPAA